MKEIKTVSILKVSSKSNPNSVAGAISAFVKNDNEVEIQSVGAGAINQAIKSVAIARGYLATTGLNLICIPAFTNIEINGTERTAIKLIIKIL